LYPTPPHNIRGGSALIQTEADYIAEGSAKQRDPTQQAEEQENVPPDNPARERTGSSLAMKDLTADKP